MYIYIYVYSINNSMVVNQSMCFVCSQVEKTMNENHSFTNDHWFKKINLGGDHFGLQTMNHYYLACQNDYSYSYDTVFLCQNVTECVQCREVFFHYSNLFCIVLIFLCSILHLLLHVLTRFPRMNHFSLACDSL